MLISLSLTWSLAWLKQSAQSHFPQILFFSVPNPSKAQLRALPQADSNHYVSQRFDWVSKLNQLKKWSSKLQSWHKANSRELEGGAALPPPLAACWICSAQDATAAISFLPSFISSCQFPTPLLRWLKHLSRATASRCRELNQQKATELSPSPAKQQFLASHHPKSVQTKNQININTSTARIERTASALPN